MSAYEANNSTCEFQRFDSGVLLRVPFFWHTTLRHTPQERNHKKTCSIHLQGRNLYPKVKETGPTNKN